MISQEPHDLPFGKEPLRLLRIRKLQRAQFEAKGLQPSDHSDMLTNRISHLSQAAYTVTLVSTFPKKYEIVKITGQSACTLNF
jgi:hypothetical protein